MERVHFSIKYDGPALQANEFDAQELAAALVAVAETIRFANVELRGDQSPVQVNVRGTFKSGSFGIDLVAVQRFGEQVMQLLAGQTMSGTANLLAVLSAIGLIGGEGLIALLKRIRGRKISRAVERDNQLILTVEEREEIAVDLDTGKLWRSRTVRAQLAQVVAPLERDGIDVFAAGRTEEPETWVTSDEAPWFDGTAEEIELNRYTVEQVCVVEGPVFKEGRKWRLNNGASIQAAIDDMHFLSEVDSGTRRFGKGDRIRVEMEVVQLDISGRIGTRYTVRKVIEHRESAQGQLPGANS